MGLLIPPYFYRGDIMTNIDKKLDYIMRQNRAMLDMMNSLIKAYAKQYNLALEEEEEECEYIDANERVNK